MTVIRQSNEDMLYFLGGEQRPMPDVIYRFNKYCIQVETDDEQILIYNGLTGAFIYLRPYELDNIGISNSLDYVEYLYRNYFLVPEDFDEVATVRDFRLKHKIHVGYNYLNNIRSFVLLTTTKCNARCPYCYENTLKGKSDMTVEMAHKVADYIIQHAKGDMISLSWFGGEPLTKPEIIDIITSRVRSAGIGVKGHITSNGYLFNDRLVNRCVTDWGVDCTQITIDGVGEKYNKVKRYVNLEDPDPFKTLISNIHNLLKHKVRVSVRMNVGPHNAEDIRELIEFLDTEFKGEEREYLTAYVWELFTTKDRTEEEASGLFGIMTELNDLIISKKLRGSEGFYYGIRAIHCMADDGESVMITPTGDVCICEHYIQSDIFSNIATPMQKDLDLIRQWQLNQDTENWENCKDCPLYASCLKLPKCTDGFLCTKAEKEYRVGKAIGDLILWYDQFKKDQEECKHQDHCCCQNN